MSDTPATAPAPAPSAPLPVRSFTEDGLAQVAELLKTIRADGQLHRKEVEDLLVDPQYAKPLAADPRQGGLLASSFAIDRDRVFATKLDLCQYFTALFDDAFLEAHRKDAGLWTWLALAYYPQFVKTKNGIAKLTANARWIFDADNYRLSVRHFIAGPIYLFRSFRETSNEAKELLFLSPPQEFGGFVDAITYKMEGTRMPALMQVAAWLYYDPASPKKLKKGVISQDKPGTVRELLRVVSQFAQTRDFYEVSDAPALWRILPKQFAGFKGTSEH